MTRYVCILWTLLLSAGAALGGTIGDAGTQSAFSFGAGARELALGGASMANADATTSPFWNPSRLASAEHIAMTGFHMRLFDSDASYQYFGVVVPTMDYGSFGVGVFRLGVDGINVRDASNVDMGTTQEEHLALYVSYGRNLSGYDFGISVTLQHQALAEYSATSSPGINASIGKNFDIGGRWIENISVVAMGINVLQPQSRLVSENVKYPLGAAVGVAADIHPGGSHNHLWTLSASARKIDYTDPRLAVGLEYKFNNLLVLRGGLQDSRSAFGAGIDVDLVRFDYAMIDRELGTLHTFALTTSFGKPMSVRRVERAERQEADFNRRMVDQFNERNRQTVARLTSEGLNFLNSHQPVEAKQSFDRALFLARGTDVDTTRLHALADTSMARLEEASRSERFSQYVDSSRTALSSQNFVLARYLAGQALEIYPNEPIAARLQTEADAAIKRSMARAQLVTTEIKKIDSLLNFGFVKAALTASMSLKEYAPENPIVQSTLERAKIEFSKSQITEAVGASEFYRARALTDSALVTYPAHRWFTDMSAQIDEALRRNYAARTPEIPREKAPELTEEMRHQVEALYSSARGAFQAGNLRTAINGWEQVEAMAPDYQSVREYLITAYKFVGVEYYGQNKLAEAVEVWKAAQRLNPENTEIREYIRRTESEIRKLKELSYEP